MSLARLFAPRAVEAVPRFCTARPMVTALGRACGWQQMLDTGDVTSVTELAERLHVDRSSASRILAALSFS